MFDIIATEIGVDDIWECAILPYAPKGAASCCLSTIRNRTGAFKFCPSCGKKIEYRLSIQRVTQLGAYLGATKDGPIKEIGDLLDPLVRGLGFVLYGPVRTGIGRPPVYLVGLCPFWNEAPSRGLYVTETSSLACMKEDVAKKMEKVTGRRCEVHYYQIRP